MTEKKDLWLVFLLGLITCGIYNMVIAITALKRIYKINGNEQGFNKRIVMWIIYYSSYYVLFFAMYIFVIVGALMTESNALENAGYALIAFSTVAWFVVWLAIPIIGLILYYQEFNVLTIVSNKHGIKTTPGYKIAAVLLGAANPMTASLIFKARLNKLLDLQNVQPTTPNTPPRTSVQNTPSTSPTKVDLTKHSVPPTPVEPTTSSVTHTNSATPTPSVTPVTQTETTEEKTSNDLLDF